MIIAQPWSELSTEQGLFLLYNKSSFDELHIIYDCLTQNQLLQLDCKTQTSRIYTDMREICTRVFISMKLRPVLKQLYLMSSSE